MWRYCGGGIDVKQDVRPTYRDFAYFVYFAHFAHFAHAIGRSYAAPEVKPGRQREPAEADVASATEGGGADFAGAESASSR